MSTESQNLFDKVLNQDVVPNKPEVSQEAGKIALIKSYLSKNYDLRYNEVNNRIEYRKAGDDGSEFEDLKDSKVNAIMFEMIENGIEVFKLRSLLNSDFVKTYNPFRDYIDTLPEWDGVDYIELLSTRIRSSNDSLTKLFLKRWLIGVVACSYDRASINEHVLILKGGQGIGKTRFVRQLVPQTLSKYYLEGKLNMRDKNASFHSSECFLINLDEFENIITSSSEEMKSMLGAPGKRLRRPYASLSEYFPRRCSFAATINSGIFLRDVTGNRRCLVVDVIEQIDNSPIDFIDKIYSQAKALLENGEPFHFTAEEQAQIEEHNKQFELIFPEAEAIRMYVRPKLESDGSVRAQTASEIAKHLAVKLKLTVSRGMIQQVGIALHALGFKPRKSNGNQVYDVVLV